MNRKNVVRKLTVLFFIGAFAALVLATPALAQKKAELQDAQKMMADGWKMFDDGQSMVIKGVEMNNLVAVQGGFQAQMEPGNKVITDGRNTVFQGAKLIAQGLKTYEDNKGTPSVAMQGLQMMVDGFKIAQDGKAMMEKGMAMNNQVAQGAGAADKFAQGSKVIQDGMGTMKNGAKLFLEGEAIFLKLK